MGETESSLLTPEYCFPSGGISIQSGVSSKVLVNSEAHAPIKHLGGLQQKDNTGDKSLRRDKNLIPALRSRMLV